MPRVFLAPYRFEVVKLPSKYNGNFLKFLETKKRKHYVDNNDQTEFILESVNVEGNKAWGYMQYGRFGSKRPVVDVKTQTKTKDIEEYESPLDNYFYLIEYNQRTKIGFMVIQRIGNIGVRSAFSNALEQWDGHLKIDPVILKLNKLLESPIMEIKIRVPKKPRDIDSRLDKFKITNEKELYVEISIKARRNKVIKLKDDILAAIRNYDLSNIGYIYDKDEEKSIVVKVGDSRRTINLTRGKVRTWVEVKNINKIKEEAEEILKEIKKEPIK